ncbi:Uncharacterized protein HZ326_24514 [Fusarium oxysporum f. sp. albedinis]|nr:Uncharacterized protein HZ326_24514 [Fusarium oxysporum f. sp. albedinis]
MVPEHERYRRWFLVGTRSTPWACTSSSRSRSTSCGSRPRSRLYSCRHTRARSLDRPRHVQIRRRRRLHGPVRGHIDPLQRVLVHSLRSIVCSYQKREVAVYNYNFCQRGNYPGVTEQGERYDLWTPYTPASAANIPSYTDDMPFSKHL